MSERSDYIAVNRALWDKKTEYHAGSAFYKTEAFVAGASSLKEIELGLLGDVRGKRILHLQCHFGQDSLSLARMGARVTGVDLSGTAIEKARELNEELALDAKFICADIYSLPDVLNETYDIVFSSYGTIVRLPDITRWAQVVARFVQPGGRFVFAETHPLALMYDDDFTEVRYAYFNTGLIVETEEGTYADRSAPISLPSHTWNHTLADVIQSLINAGLTLTTLREYDYSPHACFGNMVEVATGQYQIKGMEGKIPLTYALEAACLSLP